MRKIFLYLYPIYEYCHVFESFQDVLNNSNIENPYGVLNECIQKRYREKGYQIVYAIYPDKSIYGIKPLSTDKIIYTDIKFYDGNGYHKDDSKKTSVKYSNEKYLIDQLGEFDEIVVGGFHFSDCVKRVAEYCYYNGYSTMVDLDLTDLFFNVYKDNDYFKLDEYNPQKYKEHVISNNPFGNIELAENLFDTNYDSPVYGFENIENKRINKL